MIAKVWIQGRQDEAIIFGVENGEMHERRKNGGSCVRSVDTHYLGVQSARRASEIGLSPSHSPLLLVVTKHS